MKYRAIGNTGLKASEIGFGCGDNAGLIVRATTKERTEGVGRAIDLGINYFDTSPDYGKGLSEANLGRVFRALKVRPIISTKVEIMPGDYDDLAGAVVTSMENSLRRLRMDWVDIVELHNAPLQEWGRTGGPTGFGSMRVDQILKPGGALEGLERLKQSGKARFIGIACAGGDPGPTRQVLDTGEMSMINVYYDLLNPTAGVPKLGDLQVDKDFGGTIDAAQRNGAGIAVIRPLGGGTLTDHMIAGGGRHPYAGGGMTRIGDAINTMVDQARCFAFLSQKGKRTLGQAAVKWILTNPAVTTALGGYSEVSQIEEMVAVSEQEPLTEQELQRIEMVWRANFGQPAGA